MNLNAVLTISELADYLQVSKSSLYKLAQEGKVPGQKVGKHWRFRRETIEKWLDEPRLTEPQSTTRVAAIAE